MKKRTMKKYIPKNTLYCYNIKYINGKRTIIPCKHWSINPSKSKQLNGYCKYLKSGDWYKKGTFLIWDQCKECNVSVNLKKMKTVKYITIKGKKIKIIDFI